MTKAPTWWPEDARTTHADLLSYRLVGASACADRITSALASIAVAAEERGADLVPALSDAGEVYCGLKPDTSLYHNIVLALVTAARGGDADLVCDRARQLTESRVSAQRDVVARTAELLANAGTVLIHDFSSTVMRVLQVLPDPASRRVVVTAGEPLGKGVQIARKAAVLGYSVTFLPDMSVARVIGDIDAYLTGVEAFYGDGSLANTVGTTMLALLCREAEVPVIAPAETLKYDGLRQTAIAAALSARLLHPWPAAPLDLPDEWSVVRFVLDAVPASVVTTFVTERGACPPSQVGRVAGEALLDLRVHDRPLR